MLDTPQRKDTCKLSMYSCTVWSLKDNSVSMNQLPSSCLPDQHLLSLSLVFISVFPNTNPVKFITSPLLRQTLQTCGQTTAKNIFTWLHCKFTKCEIL